MTGIGVVPFYVTGLAILAAALLTTAFVLCFWEIQQQLRRWRRGGVLFAHPAKSAGMRGGNSTGKGGEQ